MIGKAVVGSVVGPASQDHWGQVLHIPSAYGVVEVAFADGGARAAGVHILTELSRKLSQNPTSLKALEDIVAGIDNEGLRSVMVFVPVGSVAYIAVRNAGDVYLKRDREFSHLLSGAGGISGNLKPGDTLLLVSEGFSRAVTQDEVQGMFDHLTPDEVAERLTLLLHKKDNGYGGAAIIVKFTGSEPDQQPVQEDRETIPERIRHVIQSIRTRPKNPRVMITIALVVIFGVSVLLGIFRQVTRVKNQAVASAIVDARHALDEGVALLTLNPVKGRERLVTAKELLTPLRDTVPARSSEGREIAQLYEEISKNLTTALQQYTVKPELFFDGALVKKDGKISFLALEGTTMGVVDQATQTVYALDITSKKVTVVGGGATYAGMSYVAIHGDKLYVLTDRGIHMAGIGDKKTVEAIVRKEDAWGQIRSLVSYGGNLYLMDTTNSRIWKYVATETGFSDLREYLNPDSLPNFSSGTGMGIDGSVWVSTADGTILKFTGGQEDSFTIKGVDPPLGTTLSTYISDETNNMYLLDRENKRVVVLDKDGMYLAQYVWEEALAPTALVVSEKEKRIFLLADGKLYAIKL